MIFPRRVLPDGRTLEVLPLFFGARLGLSRPRDDQDGGYDDVWDYPDIAAAVAAMVAWDGQGEPDGWHRHPASGRRRPDCDPAREHVNP